MKQTSIGYWIPRLATIAALAGLTSSTALAQPEPAPQPDGQPPPASADPASPPAGQDTPAAAQPTPAPSTPPAPAPAPVPAPAPATPAANDTPAPQPADPQPATDDLSADEVPVDEDSEVIVITGSRIRTDPLDKPAPVLQITREEIERSGLTSVADLLQRLPVSGGALNTKFNSSGNFGFPPDGGGIGAGAAQAELRYLGSKRVLVLVDGVRWINGSSASGVSAATDLNTIPLGIIERVEVLQDGASAIYGSDAIGGVINIITKRNFEGVQANVYTGGYNEGDGFTQQYDVSWGGKSDKLSYIFGLSFVDQRRIKAEDRELSKFPLPEVGQCTDTSCSSGTPQGRFFLIDPNTGERVNVTINNGTTGIPVYNPLDPNNSGDFNAFDTTDRFNFAPFNLMLTPSQRIGAFSGIEYELHPRVKLYARSLFSHRDSTNQAAPEPIFIGPEAGNGNRLDTISIHETNPYNPFGFTIDARTNPYFIGRRPIESGPRVFEQSVNTWYVTGGLRGDFKVNKSKFYWDTGVVYALNRADQLKRGAFNSAKLEKALGPLDECNADPQCVPFNIFGGQGIDSDGDGVRDGTITQEMLDYVGFVQKDVSEQQLFDVTANISGDLLQLPAGPLSLALGVEYRDQEGFFQPDAVVVAGDSAGVPSSPTSGSFHATEGYAEVRVPILSKMPGANLLDVSGAVRVADYSTFGAEATFKAGMRWRPNQDLLVRGGFAQGFRAPGIGELFGSDARFDQTLNDRCSDFLGNEPESTAQPDNIQANCIALGAPADGSYVQLNPQISVTTGGNRELEAETSNSATGSLVYSPSALENAVSFIDSFDIELTYYWISLDGAVAAIDAQIQLDSCIEDPQPGDGGVPTNPLCDGITRSSGGAINGFANQLTNIGGIDTSGIDISLGYRSPRYSWGGLRVTSISTYLLEFVEKIPASDGGFDEIKRQGTEIGDPERGFPRFKSTLILDWWRDEWRASFTSRYIHSITEPCRGLQVAFPGLCSDPDLENDDNSTNKLDPTVYNDIQVTYTPRALEDRLDVTIGVNNMFNQDPPSCFSCALNGFDATTYDVPGVFGYLKAGYRM